VAEALRFVVSKSQINRQTHKRREIFCILSLYNL